VKAGSEYVYRSSSDFDSAHAWNGIKHEYASPQGCRAWNLWRSLRILLSRVQEAVFRRSWPRLAQAPPSPQHYRSIRNRMTAEICVAAAYAFGNDSSAEPPKGSISTGYHLVDPLTLAGSCLLEQLAEPAATPGGSRVIMLDRPLHIDQFNQVSTQLAWVIARLDYIANTVGIQWALVKSRLLKGESRVYYDLSRS
jgi:hypothetical protein